MLNFLILFTILVHTAKSSDHNLQSNSLIKIYQRTLEHIKRYDDEMMKEGVDNVKFHELLKAEIKDQELINLDRSVRRVLNSLKSSKQLKKTLKYYDDFFDNFLFNTGLDFKADFNLSRDYNFYKCRKEKCEKRVKRKSTKNEEISVEELDGIYNKLKAISKYLKMETINVIEDIDDNILFYDKKRFDNKTDSVSDSDSDNDFYDGDDDDIYETRYVVVDEKKERYLKNKEKERILKNKEKEDKVDSKPEVTDLEDLEDGMVADKSPSMLESLVSEKTEKPEKLEEKIKEKVKVKTQKKIEFEKLQKKLKNSKLKGRNKKRKKILKALEEKKFEINELIKKLKKKLVTTEFAIDDSDDLKNIHSKRDTRQKVTQPMNIVDNKVNELSKKVIQNLKASLEKNKKRLGKVHYVGEDTRYHRVLAELQDEVHFVEDVVTLINEYYMKKAGQGSVLYNELVELARGE